MSELPIRTLQVLDNYFPMVDGVIQTVHNYATVLNQTAPTAVMFPQQKGEYDYAALPYPVFRVKPIQLISMEEYALPSPLAYPELTEFLGEFKPELIHVHSPFFLGETALHYAKKRHIPCVATFHSKYYDDAMNVTHSKIIARAVAKNVVRVYRMADQVWACSAGTAETLRSYGFEGEVTVMDNGTNFFYEAGQLAALRRRAGQELALSPERKQLLFVGHLIWHKNLRLILDSFRLVYARDPAFQLLIVGEGYDGEAIRAYAEELALPEDAIRFLGKITDRDLLAGVMAAADLFFFPSVYDNSPLVVREAAAVGLPALLTAGSNAAEVVTKDLNGFTAEETPEAMSRELLRIFSEPGLLARAGEAAARTIPKSWPQIVSAVKAQYAALLGR